MAAQTCNGRRFVIRRSSNGSEPVGSRGSRDVRCLVLTPAHSLRTRGESEPALPGEPVRSHAHFLNFITSLPAMPVLSIVEPQFIGGMYLLTITPGEDSQLKQ
jgi:hypothetical protein